MSRPEPRLPGLPRRTAKGVQRLLLVVFGVALVFAGLAAVELLLGVLHVGDDTLYEDPFIGFSGSELFARRTLADGTAIYETRPAKLKFFNLQQFPAEKPDGGYRIFALGGSTTQGQPYDHRVAFAAWLERYLRAADPSRSWEVINAGALSYASYRIVALEKELLRFAPDLFVVYTGHNEFLEERSYSQLIHQPAWRKRLRLWLDGRRIYGLSRRAWRSLRGGGDARQQTAGATVAAEVTTRLEGWTGLDQYHRDPEAAQSIVAAFEYNLRQMIAIAESAGVGIVFVEPAANLADFSPFKSEPGAERTAEDRRRFDALLAEGRALLDSGDAAAALGPLRAAVAIDGEHADGRFRLGRALLATGDVEGARRELVAAKELDVAPLRALDAEIAALRRVTAEAGIPLVPLPDLLEERGRAALGHDLLGSELFLDHVHPDIATHSLIAEQLLAVLVEQGVARPGESWTPAARQAIYDQEVAKLDRMDYALRDLDLAKVLGWAGKLEEAEPPLVRAAEVLGDDPEVQLNLGIVWQRTGRLAASAEALEKAVAGMPDSAEARLNLGITLGALGRLDDGIAALRRALALRPGYPEAAFNLGVLLRRAGRAEESLAVLGSVGGEHGESDELLAARALALQQAGRGEEAIALFRKVLASSPESHGLRAELGLALAQSGRLEEAEAELASVVEGAPDDAEAAYNLGLVRARRGDPAGSEAAYREALRRNPEHPRACNNLALVAIGRGDRQEAEVLLQRAVEAAPAFPEAHLNLGVLLDQLGRPQEALREVARAVELDPANLRAQVAYGALLAAAGRVGEARAMLARAAEAGSEEARALLNRLR